MSHLSRIYQNWLRKYPYGSQAIQTAILMGVGDCLSQIGVEKKSLNEYTIMRTIKFASFGLFVAGPALRGWYGVLDKYIKYQAPKSTIIKVAADQLIFAPTFLAIFLGTMGLLNGDNMQQITDRINRDYEDIIITNWKIWPLVQMANFYFVPLQYRVLVVQIVAIFWNTYLAFVTNRSS